VAARQAEPGDGRRTFMAAKPARFFQNELIGAMAA